MKQTIRDIIGSGRNQSADSRAVALTRLSSCLQETGPIVIWLHGMAGAGKGSLLDAFALNTAGTRVVRIDCRTIEPTPAGLLATLGDFGLQARAVLVFENYEVLKYGASTRTVGSITLENRRMNWKNLRFLAVCTLAIASNMITMSVLAGDEEAVAGPTLYERMGSSDGITQIVEDLIALHQKNPAISHYFDDVDLDRLATNVVAFLVAGTGGPANYEGRDMTS